jgi:hypothetical protein
MRLIDGLSKAQRVVVVIALGLAAWLRLIVWLGLIGVWALASVRVLRPSAGPAAHD